MPTVALTITVFQREQMGRSLYDIFVEMAGLILIAAIESDPMVALEELNSRFVTTVTST